MINCPPLTGLQVAAGFVTWMNTLEVFAITIGTVCICYLLYSWFGWLLKAFLHVPIQAYEGLGYLASVGLLIGSFWISSDNQLWSLLGGSLLFGGMLMITAHFHKIEPNYQNFFGTLFLVWAAVAVVFQNHYIGFIAIAAFMSMVGFSFIAGPLCYAIGFRDEDALGRSTAAGFLLVGFILLTLLKDNPIFKYIDVFTQGAIWLGSFVGFTGLLIASTRWYTNRANYMVMQVITILFGIAALAIGSILDVPQLSGIGGTFFVLYLIEKPFEIPLESKTAYATIGLMVSLTLGVTIWWAQNHLDAIHPYLLF